MRKLKGQYYEMAKRINLLPTTVQADRKKRRGFALKTSDCIDQVAAG